MIINILTEPNHDLVGYLIMKNIILNMNYLTEI
jgi:hypothetical protein